MIAFRARWGRFWAARLDVDAAIRVLDGAGVDVMAAAVDPATRGRLADLSADSSADLALAVYWIFQPQADRLGVTPRRFGRHLKALTNPQLRDAFFEEVAAFFRMPGPPPKDEEESGRRLIPADLWQMLYRLAGEAGIPPGPYTFGELAVMADGRRRPEWARNALARADFANANPFRSGPPVDPAALDPTGGLKESARPRDGVEVTPENFAGVFGALMKGLA